MVCFPHLFALPSKLAGISFENLLLFDVAYVTWMQKFAASKNETDLAKGTSTDAKVKGYLIGCQFAVLNLEDRYQNDGSCKRDICRPY